MGLSRSTIWHIAPFSHHLQIHTHIHVGYERLSCDWSEPDVLSYMSFSQDFCLLIWYSDCPRIKKKKKNHIVWALH